MTITKVIIPVAGYGTRFLPVTKAMPKEMLPVVDKPIIQYLVEEAVASGMTDIIFVTGRGKRAIEDHFDVSYELERTLVEREKHDLLKIVEPISRMARFTYVRQPMPLGNGDAILRAAHLLGNDEPFAVLFGDDLVDSRVPALKQLLRVFQRYGDPVVALARVSRRDLQRYGMAIGVETERGVWELRRIVEKPTASEARAERRVPHSVIGKYILTPGVMATIRDLQKRDKGGTNRSQTEVGVTNGLSVYLKERPVYGVEILGKWYDCGGKIGYLQANIAYARRRPELRRGLRIG